MTFTCAFPLYANAQDRFHRVQFGDTLSEIAVKFYDDVTLWPEIARANPNTVRRGGAMISVGANLRIPDLGREAAGDGDPSRRPEMTAPAAGGNRGIIRIIPAITTNTQPQTGGVTARATSDGLGDPGFNSPVGGDVYVVTGNQYKPFSDKALPEGGLFTEIVRTAFGRMGVELLFDFMPWNDGYDRALRGRYVATFPYAKTPERAAEYHFSAPIFDQLMVPYHRADSPLQISSLADLNGLTACRPPGYYTTFIDAQIEAGQVILERPADMQTCFNMLVRGEVDVVLEVEIVGAGIINDMNLKDQVVASETILDITSLHVIFPVASGSGRSLQYRFDQQLAAMDRDGTLNDIMRRHIMAHRAGTSF